jgi:hypothetical protein
MGTAACDWYFAGRRHAFFAAEPDIYNDSLRAFAVPELPPTERATRPRADRLEIRAVELLPAGDGDA